VRDGGGDDGGDGGAGGGGGRGEWEKKYASRVVAVLMLVEAAGGVPVWCVCVCLCLF
jgi:hypothetical protein